MATDLSQRYLDLCRRYLDLCRRLDGSTVRMVDRQRDMAQGYALGHQYGDDSTTRDYNLPYAFGCAFGLWWAEFRLGLDVDDPSLAKGWRRFTQNEPVSDYRRRLGEGESRPVKVGQ